MSTCRCSDNSQSDSARSASVTFSGGGRPRSDQIWQWGLLAQSQTVSVFMFLTKQPFYTRTQWLTGYVGIPFAFASAMMACITSR